MCMSCMGWKSEVNEMRRDEMIVSDVCALNLAGCGCEDLVKWRWVVAREGWSDS